MIKLDLLDIFTWVEATAQFMISSYTNMGHMTMATFC